MRCALEIMVGPPPADGLLCTALFVATELVTGRNG
jgi:hypothetical protein